MKTIEDFRGYFQAELLPVLEPLEQMRRHTKKNVWIVLLVTIIATIPVAWQAGWWGAAPAGLGVLIALIVSGASAIKIRGRFKRDVMPRLTAFLGEEIEYSPTGCIPEPVFISSGLFKQRIDRYKGEDMLKGCIGKTEFMCSEVHAEHKTQTTDGNGHTRTQWHTIFKGLYFVADFNKDFNHRTLVMPDIAGRLAGSFLGDLLHKLDFTTPGKLVKLEDPEFEKWFAVFSDNDIECRYILTPALMQRLVDFRARFKADLMLSFVNSSVHVAMPTGRRIFEISMSKKLTDFEEMASHYRDLIFITGIVEDLNLNTRIWTKE